MWNTREVFWLERPSALVSKMKIIPREEMSLAEQMNALTRLVILSFMVLNLFGYKDAKLFLLLSIIFIIILYYLQKQKMATCENYEPDVTNRDRLLSSNILPKPNIPYVPQKFSPVDVPHEELARQNYIAKTEHLYQQFKNQPRTTLANHPSYFNQQVGRMVEEIPDQRYVSNNQKLVGGANPKTKIKPVVAPPAYEWTYWKDNDFVLPAQINTRSVQDYYASGYYVDLPPTEVNDEMAAMVGPPAAGPKRVPPHSCAGPPPPPPMHEMGRPVGQRDIVENYEEVTPVQRANDYFRFAQKSTGVYDPCAKDKCTYNYNGVTPIQKDNGDFVKLAKRNEPLKTSGDLDDALGYDESNLDYNWPSNYPAGNCERTSNMKDFNKQIFTSTIVPGVYYNSQIIEPISSNIGISFDQQIPPRQVTRDDQGNIIYEARDPRQFKPEPLKKPEFNVPSVSDVYDPRFDGYGTADRAYTDKLTGQPRFYYDDVDAIKRPNYVTRSNIDFLCNADSYGPIQNTAAERQMNERIRLTADQSYTDNTLDFRTEMMTRLMRKRNAELWQTRLAPMTTMKK